MVGLKEIFKQFDIPKSYRLVDPKHPIEMFVGIDENYNYSLLCLTKDRPENVESSAIITASVGNMRFDKTYPILFSLTNRELLEHFVCFCKDLIISSRNIRNTDKAGNFYIQRYKQWQKAFSIFGKQHLSSAEVKGLIGELYVLQNVLIPNYGAEYAINSWIGPEMAPQDFVCDNTWFEVKSTTSGREIVNISSVQQLDDMHNGHLVIVRLDKTSVNDADKLTLNEMYDSVLKKLDREEVQDLLKTRMAKLGYLPDRIYDQLCYKFNGFDIYRVDKTFPCLRKQSLPAAVCDVKYALSLAAINNFKE